MSDEERKKIFSQNLNNILRLKRKSQIEVANAIGVSQQTFNTWCRGVALPRMGKVQLLADYFNINMANLLEPSPSTAATPALSPDKEELLANYDKLNDEGKQDARKYVKLLGNSPEYTEDAEDTGNGNITA